MGHCTNHRTKRPGRRRNCLRCSWPQKGIDNECKDPDGNSQKMSLDIQVGYLGEEGILWSLFLNVHLSYQHLIGDKERGNQAMGLCLTCDGVFVVEIGIKIQSGVIFKEKREWNVEKGRLAAGEVERMGPEWCCISPWTSGGLWARECTWPSLSAFLFRSCGCKPFLSQC